ncbi:MAG: hypothetical protein DLM65_06995 [Candidatus Aeolococcus gillhamiae]|uniref:J domain-containing protein n=1 Tax=Candidatus Aeolococcus gillhamiae TaxID=3127015 RepID=A0A2W5Z6H2_9BACT|nr:MAG: hypothetical protein DLM65_06995 [Candidatus Dormibacter sp. RRmetagenome_bin12]
MRSVEATEKLAEIRLPRAELKGKLIHLSLLLRPQLGLSRWDPHGGRGTAVRQPGPRVADPALDEQVPQRCALFEGEGPQRAAPQRVLCQRQAEDRSDQVHLSRGRTSRGRRILHGRDCIGWPLAANARRICRVCRFAVRRDRVQRGAVATAFQDYYAILGVPKTATQKEIKAAFRKAARKHHPDLNQNDSAAERRFKEINEANEVLSDPKKRGLYDEVGPRWREYEAWDKAGRPGPSPFGAAQGGFGSGGGPQVEYRTVSPDELESMFGDADPFSDFFHSMFGRSSAGGARSRTRVAPRRGEDVEGTTDITLEEAYTGTKRIIELSGGGRSRRVEISIPAGVADGARVRAAGQGGAGSDGAGSGDLFVRVRVRPHPRFTRDRSDLREQVEVPLDVALLGGEIPVRTLRGTTAQLSIPPTTQNGARLRLRGLGLPKLHGDGHGDLIAEVSVRLPSQLTPAAERLVEELRAEREGGATT